MGDVVQSRDVSGGIHFHGVGQEIVPPPRQLPGDVRGFVNRAAELARLDNAYTQGMADPNTSTVLILNGTPGVGKTSLAVHWSHQAKQQFPDGQFYVNLHGYDPGPQVTAQDVLDRFLRALDVRPAAISVDQDARSAQFRSLVADRKFLIVLDNAATTGQVRPLLPGTSSSVVLVTSRSRLPGLGAADGARRVSVGVLSEEQSVELLRSVIDGYRDDSDDDLAQLARLSARLPIALRVAAERVVARPDRPLPELIADCRDKDKTALWELLSSDDDEESTAVRTVFSWSYRALSARTARVFRLLGLHPGAQFSIHAAAALIEEPINVTRRQLDILVGAHLLEVVAYDRYQLHDLLRAYANDLVGEEDSASTQRVALARILTWYCEMAGRMSGYWGTPVIELPETSPNLTVIASREEAWRWFTEERTNLLEVVQSAQEAQLWDVCWKMPVVLHDVYANNNISEDWAFCLERGHPAAVRTENRAAQSYLQASYGMMYKQSHQSDKAIEHYGLAASHYREMADHRGLTWVLNGLGRTRLALRQFDESERSFLEAQGILLAMDYPFMLGYIWLNLGDLYRMLGRIDESRAYLTRLLEAIADDSGVADCTGDVLAYQGDLARQEGDYPAAIKFLRRSIDWCTEQRMPGMLPISTRSLGQAHYEQGEYAVALECFHESSAAARRLNDQVWEAQGWDWTGLAYQRLGRIVDAIGFHQRAIATFRKFRSPLLALALDNMATAAHELGQEDRAQAMWIESAGLLESFPDEPAHARLRLVRARIRG
jgi:tetratricopeptide (TPR) repeat protein